MALCTKCGAFVDDSAKVCESCGTPVGADATQNAGTQQTVFDKFTDTEDATAAFSQEDIEKNKAMAVIAYLGILVLVPIFAAKESPFAKFHSNQGLVLLLAGIAYSIATGIINSIVHLAVLRSIFSIAGLLFLALMILGIVNAVNGKAKKLPVIGDITLLK